MKILLMTPPLSRKDRYGKFLEKVGPSTEPLGLAYLAAMLEKNNYKVEILDSIALKKDSNNILNHIKKNNYDVVGITMLTPMYLRACEIIKKIRKENKKIKIIVGGPHVTIMPERTLKENKEIDVAMHGEGEITIIELIKAFERNKSLKNIKGIAYRSKDKVIMNKPREFIKNLDEIPLPARHLLPMKVYNPAPTYYRRLPSYIIMTSRGCPYRCVYCSRIFGKTFRLHSVERILGEMKILIEKYGAKEIIFRDDTFTINKKYVKELCNEIIKRGYHKKIEWTCMTRVNLVDKEILKLMRKAGCWSMHYGIETGSQRLLDMIKKDIKVEQIRNAIKWTREAGIETKAFFMLGLPSETREESLATLKFTKELDPDWIQVTITTPYPGTELYYLAKANGDLKSLKWENYQSWAGFADVDLVYVTKGRNAEELKKLQKRALREFYFRPKVILRHLFHLRSFNMFKKYFQGAYALFRS